MHLYTKYKFSKQLSLKEDETILLEEIDTEEYDEDNIGSIIHEPFKPNYMINGVKFTLSDIISNKDDRYIDSLDGIIDENNVLTLYTNEVKITNISYRVIKINEIGEY